MRGKSKGKRVIIDREKALERKIKRLVVSKQLGGNYVECMREDYKIANDIHGLRFMLVLINLVVSTNKQNEILAKVKQIGEDVGKYDDVLQSIYNLPGIKYMSFGIYSAELKRLNGIINERRN